MTRLYLLLIYTSSLPFRACLSPTPFRDSR
nr:MAG TPA: hypothetical protein [Caudoviricetes sp.]